MPSCAPLSPTSARELTNFVTALTAAAPVRPVLLSTDGVHIDRPFIPEERPAQLAYLRKL